MYICMYSAPEDPFKTLPISNNEALMAYVPLESQWYHWGCCATTRSHASHFEASLLGKAPLPPTLGYTRALLAPHQRRSRPLCGLDSCWGCVGPQDRQALESLPADWTVCSNTETIATAKPSCMQNAQRPDGPRSSMRIDPHTRGQVSELLPWSAGNGTVCASICTLYTSALGAPSRKEKEH